MLTTEHSVNAAIKAFVKKFITRVKDGTLDEEPTMARDLEGLIIQKNKEADDAAKAWKALGKTDLYASQDFLDALKAANSDKIKGLGHPGRDAVYLAVVRVLRASFKGQLVLDKRGMSNPSKTQAKSDLIVFFKVSRIRYCCVWFPGGQSPAVRGRSWGATVRTAYTWSRGGQSGPCFPSWTRLGPAEACQ